MNMNSVIEQLVAALPEKYQPIFGHPDISDEASRACEDRLAVIREAHDALQVLLGRPLRVLDLGCAQGYFSLSLAAAGADVLGIDYLPANVAVCEALASECPDLKAKFQVGRIEDVIEEIKPDRFDLVLGLSVFHHVIHEKGVPAVKKLLNIAADRVGFMLLEMALKSEPLYWASSQPEDPRELLDDMAFSHQLALYPTHLADIPRPMFAASNRFWVLNGQAQQILSWTTEPHSLAPTVHQGGRRYYKSTSRFLKWYRIDQPRWQYNKEDFQREVDFLERIPSGFIAPKKIAHGSSNSEAWLVMDRIEGELLSELLINGAELDIEKVLGDVINQACILEAAGWYHNDIRTWNTLIQEDGSVVVIDYGSMLHKPQDCVWPNDIFLAFLIFVYEVATRHVQPPIPLRAVAMSPGRFPAPYDVLVRRLWNVPVAEWSFSLIRRFFGEMKSQVEASIQPAEAWSTAIELAMQTLSTNQHHLGVKVQQAEATAQQAEATAQQAEATAQQAEATAQQAEATAQQAETRATHLQTELDAVHAANHHHWELAQVRAQQIDAIYQSRSWRITAPLRRVSLVVCSLTPNAIKPRIKVFLQHAALYLRRRPRLKNAALRVLCRFPGLKSRLFRVVAGIKTPPARPENIPTDIAHLSPRARKIHAGLKAAIERRQKENC